MKNKSTTKKPKTIRMKRSEERTLPVKHVFGDNEKLELGDKLTSTMQTFAEVESQLKSYSADFKARLKILQAERDAIANKFRDGYEMRDIKCIVHFNTATEKGKPVKKPGMKRITHAATKEFIRDEPMSPTDLQAELFQTEKLKEESKKAKAKKSPNVSGERLNAPEIPEEGDKTSTAATA